MSLKRTPLYEIHKSLGARMVPFGGWEMPVQYSGVIDEHETVRQKAGLFDISHMGEIFVEGPQAQAFINHVTTNDITRIADFGCQYAALCREDGGIVDDVISYQFSPQKYLVVVNASNADKDFEWLQAQQNGFDVTVSNRSPDYGQLALQGPLSEKILGPLCADELSELKYYAFCETQVAGVKAIVSRTGYTGEDGFEIYAAADKTLFLWQEMMKAGAKDGLKPIGLAARDTLRLESAYSLYGHEIDDTVNPLEARLSWIVKLDKSDFVGKKALVKIKEEGPKRKLIGLTLLENGVARDGYPVFSKGEAVGKITSGTFSPTLKKPIALALVTVNCDLTDLAVEIRGNLKKAAQATLPFYKKQENK